MMKRMILILTLSMFLVSCQTKETAAPTVEQTEIPTASSTPEPSATPTPVPPTETPTATSTPTQTPTPEPTATLSFLESYPEEGYGPIGFPPDINPLTGLLVDDPAILDRRPVSIKVSNYQRRIRPQWGLSLADHVFEYYHEGGLTRFNAIFYGNNAEQIGPIRSARFSDKDIVEMYDAIFAYASGDWRVRYRLSYADFWDRMATISDAPCPPSAQHPLCRIEQDTWNHLVTNLDVLYQHFDDKGIANNRQNLDGLYFNTALPPDGQPASSVTVRYSYGSYHKWVYDPILGKYIRYQDVVDADPNSEEYEPMTDRLNGELITADNVLVLMARHDYYLRTPEMIEIPFDGFGKAYLFREGHVYLINWARLVNSDVLTLSYDDGNRFPLKPGNTWFDIIGLSSQTVLESPDWRFQSFIP
jgi:hypothetical protein